MAKNDKTVKRGVYLYIDGKEIKNDINSIDLEMKRLQRDIKDMTRGSEEYNRTMAKIQHLQGILKQHRQEIKGITTETKKATVSIGKMADWFNRFGGVILSVIGFLTGFALALRSIREERNKLEESQAGLKALTGLDDESITWLTAQAKTLSTTMTKEGLRVRQSAAEILDAFMLVGSAKPELLGDKEALKAVTEEAMRLQAAAKDITLNEAVDSLTLSLNQYGAAADQAGRYANVLAAGSKAGSANIASQAKAIRTAGTSAAGANVSIEQTVGLIETLAYRGIKDEVAGTGLKKFFLVLQTGADETNPKLVGLDKALENLKNKNMDAGAIEKMFGEEGFNTASVILRNTEMVKDFTAAVTGTNVAYEQAAINSDTAQARLEQARNKMKLAAIDLGEKLNPALAVSTNMLTNILKILPGLIDWFQKWGPTLIVLLAPVAAYIGYLKFMVVYHTTLNFLVKQATVVQTAYRLATIALNDALAGDCKALTRLFLQMRSSNIMTKVITASTLLFRAAVETLTFRFGAAAKAARSAWVVLGLNPIAAVTGLVVAAAGAWYLYSKRMSQVNQHKRDLNHINREAGKGLAEEKAKIDLLLASIHNSNTENTKRIEAINELKKIIPEYNAEISKEGEIINENTEAIKSYLTQLERQMKMSAVSEKMRELYRKQFEQREKVNTRKNEVDNLEKEYASQNDTLPDYGGYRAMGRSSNLIALRNALEKEEKELEDIDSRINNLKTFYGSLIETPPVSNEGARTIEMVTKELNNAKNVLEKLESANTEYFSSGELVAYNAQLKKASVTVTQLSDELQKLEDAEKERKRRAGSNGGSEEGADKNIFARAEAAYYNKIADIKKQYLDGTIKTQTDYNKRMQEAELGLLHDKMEVAGLEPEERRRIADKVLDIQIKMRDDLHKAEEDAEKEAENQRKKTSEQTFSRLDREYQLKVEEATMSHYQRLTSEQELYIELRRLQNEYYQQILNDTTISEEKKNKIRKQLRDRDLNDAKEKSDKELEEQKEFARICVELAQNSSEALGDALADVLTAQDDAMKNLWKLLLLTAVSAIEQYLRLTYIKTLADSIIGLKFWKALPALAKIAAIEASFAAVKGVISNFYTGGYTGPGDWDQPKGFVHSNEFVANRFAVANPNLRPIFDVIDVAQRTGNVGNLTATDIAAVAGSGKSAPAVPVKVGSTNATTTTNDPAIMAVLTECTRVLRKLKVRLDDPLVAETYVTGKRGINQAQKEYDKLMNNIKRKK